MKKQKEEELENNIFKIDDDNTILEITEGLKVIDQIPICTPNLEWFEETALESKALLKKKFRKDLMLFLLVAAIILSGVIVILFRMPTIFLGIQIMVIAFMAVYSGILVVKKVEDL